MRAPRAENAGEHTRPAAPPAPGPAAPADGPLPRGNNVSADAFRRALGAHAAGVVVVTADPAAGRGGGAPVGITATSFTSVSLDPPLVSFYINAASGSWPGIRDARSFAVNVLADDQSGAAARFAARNTDRFAPPTRWHRGADGLPLLDGAVAHVLCCRHDILAVGDHWLVVGRVAHAEVATATRPLVYHRSRYGGFTPHEPP
ncbi:flavin reductase (DIM6/NTAB) family NADH-FMN oxidoreductase RutF [Murinocardiopsis flavida]|uniref:Flavin reductase (DIM6/NTAB) family NADH-FMN oxidoreductase RutF n=1 Tax=Murinocardiopsis flavida TaxID=645275 RepID=A0A2P8DSK3_9ACTN|nr:flavin reductase family protein [Murinocardiopsis flavida]PSL00188.1 flavin reductase (DIM6/NTAB) family NADH-FMN oxidoreductase RutF [Murinocardiopsis flavida]